jgi:predicted ArsR family transcriptional regulator
MTRKRNGRESPTRAGRFAYDGLERVIHERARLGILASLAVHEDGLLFSDLKELFSHTDGNLSRHMTVLNEAGLVEIWKGQQGPRPQTMYRLTSNGRRQFADYVNVLAGIVADAHRGKQSDSRDRRLSGGWSPA